MKTFYTRAISAFIFGIIMLGGILWNEASFFILFLIIALGCTREYFTLVENIDPGYLQVSSWHRPCVYLLVVAVFFLFSGTHFQIVYIPAGFLGLWGSFMLIIIIFINEGLFMPRLRFRNLWYSLLGLIYIAMPFGLMVNLRWDYSWNHIAVIPLGIVFCIWINDTMAYMVGSLIGKTKFFPSISPRKTWEGTIGGIIITIIAGAIYGFFGHTYSLVDWMIIAAIASIFGTAGDLLESKIKRLAGVKDSGNLMP
ncbi:MAG: phosphatidate cytidylyltransferase, partial [Chitinophagaceae bacterium]